MKSLITVFSLLVVWGSGAWITPQEASAQQVSVSFQVFYDDLSPYGTWVDHPTYGYVWMPAGEPEFSPYVTAGHWVFTDDGWTWVSDYPWGWGPFHYGRWDYDDMYGWLWVPDYEWGPAWVSWRRSPGYYGWAPLRPGISLSIAFGGGYHERNERWIFVRDRDLSRSDIGGHYVNRNENTTIINRSTVIVNTRRDDKRNGTYVAGPTRDDFQKVTHTTVAPVAIRDADRPGHHLSNNELQIYRPQVQKRADKGPGPAPSKVVKLNEVKPVSERKTGNRQQDANPVDNGRKDQPYQPRNIAPPGNTGRERQPEAVTHANPSQPPQTRDVNPSESRPREQQQPRAVSPPSPPQAQQPRNVIPPDTKARERQPRAITHPNPSQPPQTRDVNPSESRAREQQQPRAVSPPSPPQAQQPRNVNPPDTKARERQPEAVTHANPAPPPQTREARPSENRGRERPPQNVAPSRKDRGAQPSQPKNNQGEKDKRGREK